jgi:5'-methylthioadenosine phosphorylase
MRNRRSNKGEQLDSKAEIGIIGGSGFYTLLKNPETFNAKNRYGAPSAAISIGEISGRRIAFIPRHGLAHTIPPHKVPCRANIEALAGMGVKRIISTGAVGSLQKEYAPGDFVFFDQFVNMTHGREDTFFDSDKVVHVSTAEPYCNELRALAIRTAKKMRLRYHEAGTVVVVNGPRFSTKAESRFFSRQGFQLISMTQYPEVALAREKALCYLGIGIVTDYDAGLEGEEGIKPVNMNELLRVFNNRVDKVKELITEMIPEIPDERGCACGAALENSAASSSK